MKFKKIMILAILLVSLLAVSAVSAADNATSDIVGVENQEDEVMTEVNDDLTLDSYDNILSTTPKTFNDLNNAINDNTKTEIYLNSDYTYNPDSDSGISFSRDLTVYGNGFTIDGANAAQIFSISSNNIIFRDIVFVNANGMLGGAIYVCGGDCTVVNCTFINNSAHFYGGAIYVEDYGVCTAVNCTFINNSARYGGGAVSYCDVVNCIFINNSADSGGALYGGSARDCDFINNTAHNGGAMYKSFAFDCSFTGNHADFGGGAVYDVAAGNCLFEYNSAQKGGAMIGAVAIDCQFNYNTASEYGGAVYSAKVSTGSKFKNNKAPEGKDTYDVTFYEKRKNTKSFTDLKKLIDTRSSDIYLNDDYAFDLSSDLDLVNNPGSPDFNGFSIDFGTTIHGNGFTIDANHAVPIFFAQYYDSTIVFRDIVFANAAGGAIRLDCEKDYGVPVRIIRYVTATFVNCTFINNFGGDGGAIRSPIKEACSAVNCIFINNSADSGGAIYYGDAVNCIFINNSADWGGAMHYGDAVNCTFINNIANHGAAMCGGSAVNCIFINNDVKDIVDEDIVNCTFINYVETRISAYGLTTVYGVCEELFVHLEDVNCNAVSDEQITVFLNNEYYNGYTDYNGDASIAIPNDLSPNTYEAVVSYAGSSEYLPSETTATIVVTKAEVDIYCDDVSMDYNDGSELIAVLTNTATGETISGLTVAVNVNGVKSSVKTDSEGRAKVPITGVAPGTYEAKISYAGNSKYSSAGRTAWVMISKADTSLSVPKTSVKYDDGSDLVVTLTHAATGNAIANANVKFNLDGVSTSVKTDSLGQARLSLSDLSPGKYAFDISYAGNNKYYSSSNSVQVVVAKADTSIFAVADNAELVATLTHGVTGKAISGAKLVVNIDGKSYSLKTDSEGRVNLTSPSKEYTATVSFAGNSKYRPSSVNVTTKTKTVISAVCDVDKSELTVTLTKGAQAKPISSVNVQIEINGVSTTVKTNKEGQAKLSTAGLPLGMNNATISYAGNSKYNPAIASISFNVKTRVIVTDVYAYSDCIVAKLTNGATGKYIANSNMIVEINGVKYNAKSDNKGLLTFDTTGLNLPDAYDLTISYRGNDRYTASTATVAVDLNKANMMITTKYHADKQKLVATLKNSKTGKIVSKANMIIDLNGVKTTYKSNDQGKITLPTSGWAPGTYVGTVTYMGNARYNSISAVFKVDI